jgi:hypothetical protein
MYSILQGVAMETCNPSHSHFLHPPPNTDCVVGASGPQVEEAWWLNGAEHPHLPSWAVCVVRGSH